MPTFVPVVDAEKPRVAQEHNNTQGKHYNFTKEITPVQSNYGIKDSSHISRSNGKMIKNEQGLWIKVKESSRSKSNDEPRSNSDDRRNEYDNDRRSSDRRERSRSRERYRRSRSRSRSDDKRYSKHHDHDYGNRYISKHRDDDRKYDKRDNRKYDNNRDRDDDRKYDKCDDRKYDNNRDRDDRKYDNHRDRDDSRIYKNDGNQNNIDRDRPLLKYEKEDSNVEINFKFNSIQVVNRFLEVYPMKNETMRLEELENLFAQDSAIYTLKNKNVLLSGRSAIVKSFIDTNKCIPNCTRRVMVEVNEVSYCYDLYPIGKTPLGNLEKPCIIFYRVVNNAFSHIYGMPDSLNLSSKHTVNSSDIFLSAGWKFATEIIKNIDGVEIDEKHNCHFHDYTNIEVWG